MRSETTDGFWNLYHALAPEIQGQADEAYRQFAADPSAPGLHFESVTPKKTIWSVRVSAQYRALGARRRSDPDLIVWFWIGTHNDYDKLINQLRRRE
jgi:hypothetical protein